MMSPSPAPITDRSVEEISRRSHDEPCFVITPSTPGVPQRSDSDQPMSKSQCSSLSDGENFEYCGEGVELDLDSGIASDRNNG